MFRKTIIAVAATAVIGVASLTPASAHGFHGWGWGWGGVGLGIGLLGASIAAQNYYAPVNNCYQYQMVQTPHGYYKRVLVNVCQ
jgi:hypothetical protein